MKKGKPLLTEAFSPEAFRFMYLLVSLLGVCPLVAPVIEPYMKLLHVYALAVLIVDLAGERRVLRNKGRVLLVIFALSYGCTMLTNRNLFGFSFLSNFLYYSEGLALVYIHTHHAMDAFRDALAAKNSGVATVVVHSHNTGALYHVQAHRAFRHLLALLPIRRFACSEAAGHWMFTKNNFRVIHNGLDLDAIYFRPERREEVRKAMGWEGQKIIGHVGRFNEQKNHRFLVAVFAEIHRKDPQTRLVLVGKGELEPEIRELVREKGLEDAVDFLGVRSDAQTLYQGMDLLLFPSLFEGLSVVLIEAQACDLPCLISNTNSQETAVTDRLCPMSLNESPERWAEEALRLLNEAPARTDNRADLRRAGYDIGALAADLERLYAEG